MFLFLFYFISPLSRQVELTEIKNLIFNRELTKDGNNKLNNIDWAQYIFCVLQGLLDDIRTEMSGLFQVMCSGGLSQLAVLRSVGLVFMFRLLWLKKKYIKCQTLDLIHKRIKTLYVQQTQNCETDR